MEKRDWRRKVAGHVAGNFRGANPHAGGEAIDVPELRRQTFTDADAVILQLPHQIGNVGNADDERLAGSFGPAQQSRTPPGYRLAGHDRI
jgi:hypothetical protein